VYIYNDLLLLLLRGPAGILFTTFISWIPNHGASYLGEGSQIPGGAQLKHTSIEYSL
jgi:AGZA family xanthine/uracil permease-like MFS transporter